MDRHKNTETIRTYENKLRRRYLSCDFQTGQSTTRKPSGTEKQEHWFDLATIEKYSRTNGAGKSCEQTENKILEWNRIMFNRNEGRTKFFSEPLP